MRQLDEAQQYFQNLSKRDQKLAIAIVLLIVITLFYTLIWEPMHLNFEKQKLDNASQQEIHSWMQNAATEVRSLRAAGNRSSKILKTNSPVSIVAEQSANTSGLKKLISKIESSGKNSAQIKIDNASFDQLLLWVNTLQTRYGITLSSAKIERTDKEGLINARFTLHRA